MVLLISIIGSISRIELREAFLFGWPYLHKDTLDSQIDSIFELADINSNGGIDYRLKCFFFIFSEFIAATVILEKTNFENSLQQTFNFLDKNKDGFITIDELINVLGN